MKKPDKSQIVDKLKERCLKDANLTFNDVVVVDFMSYLRSRMVMEKEQDPEDKPTFRKYIEKFFYKGITLHNTTKMFHVIFDSYVQGSIKGPERSRRTGRLSGIVYLADIKDETPVPQQMDKFWKSSGNKVLQSFAKKKLADLAKLNDVYLILGGQVIDDGYQRIETSAHYAHSADEEIAELASDLDEADMTIIT